MRVDQGRSQTGTDVRLGRGDRLTVLDPCGEQVSDLTLAAVDDPAEVFSSGRTTDYGNSVYVSTQIPPLEQPQPGARRGRGGHCRVHDHHAVQPQHTFDILYPDLGGAPHSSCFVNLKSVPYSHGVDLDRIGTTLNVFMDVWTDPTGELHIDLPPHPPRRLLHHRGLDAAIVESPCSAEKSNNGCAPPSTCASTG